MVLAIRVEWLFTFRELGSTGNYFQELGEQAHILGDLGSPAKKQKKSHIKGKAFISFHFFLNLRLLGGSPPDPLEKSRCINFRADMLIWIRIGDSYGV